MSLLVWLPLTNSTENLGLNNDVFKDGGSTLTTGGKLGPCHYLNGKTLSRPNFTALHNTKEFSACCWVKFTSFPSAGNNAYCICLNNTSSSSYKFIMGVFSASSSDGTTAAFRLNLLSGSKEVKGLVLNQWYHLAVCISDTTGYMYINGELRNTVTGITQSMASNLIIGGRSTNSGGTAFTGVGAPAYYNDIRIYDHCLSPREVKQISRGLVMHYALDNGNNTNLIPKSYNFNNSVNTTIDPTYGWHVLSGDNTAGTSYKDLYVSSNVANVQYGDIYTVSFYAKSSTSTGLTTYLYQNVAGVQVSNILSSQNYTGTSSDGNCRFTLTPQWKRYWVRYTFNGSRDSSTAALNKHLVIRMLAGDKVDIAGVKVEKGPFSTPYGLKPDELPSPLLETDLSGFGNHATRSAIMSYTSDSKRYGSATTFTGSSYIKQSGLDTKNWSDFTISAWVNPSSLTATGSSTDRQTILIGGMYLTLANGAVSTYCYGKANPGYHTTTKKIPINEWSHIAATWDAEGNHVIYINGVAELTKTGVTGVTNDSYSTKKEIGAETDGASRRFHGSISDVRLYATALNDIDIKELYQSTASMHENGVLQCHTTMETLGGTKFKENGILQANDISEIGYTSGMKTKVLSDGSAWARIYWLDLKTDKTCFTNDEVAFCDATNRFSRMGLVDYFKSYTLPKGYTKLNYIESTGTQYIDTNYYWTTESVKISMDAYITSNASNQSLFGNEEKFTGGDRYFCIIPHGNNGSFSLYVGSSGGLGSVTTGLETRFTLDCDTTTDKVFSVSLNGAQVFSKTYAGTVMSYANTSSTDASRGKIYIFANHNSSSGAAAIQNIGGMRLYAFKMWDGGKLVRDFIPVKKDDGTIGLFDKVFNVFYPNAGTGTFTAGSVSTNAQTDTGTYEFMLTYPSLSATLYNRWTQTSSPNVSAGKATGLSKITTAWSKHSGAITTITSSHKSSAVYAMNEAGNWWAPIGQKTVYNSTGIPAADGSNQTETELWVRIDNLQKINKISMLDNGSIQALNIYEI